MHNDVYRKMIQMIQTTYAQNGPERSKMVLMIWKGPERSKIFQNGHNGRKWL